MMGNPRILGQNNRVLSATTVTVTSETSGYPKAYLQDERDYLQWKATSTSNQDLVFDLGANEATASTAWGMAGHNLDTADAVATLYGSTNGSDYTQLATYTPTTDFTWARFFTNTTAYRYYKVSLTSLAAAPVIGYIFVGPHFEFEVLPDTPLDPDQQEDISTKEVGGTGHLLGVALDYTLRHQSWSFQYLSQSWVANTWMPFWNAWRNRPFIFVWDYVGYPAAAYFMRFDMKKMTAPFDDIYRSLSIELEGVLEE